jgi:hypothetical protein
MLKAIVVCIEYAIDVQRGLARSFLGVERRRIPERLAAGSLSPARRRCPGSKNPQYAGNTTRPFRARQHHDLTDFGRARLTNSALIGFHQRLALV